MVAAYSRFDRLPVNLSRSASASLPAQLAEQIRALVLQGVLQAGETLPSSRALAQQLNVSRGTVVFAYEQLVGEGYLTASPGGTRVASQLAPLADSRQIQPASPKRQKTGGPTFQTPVEPAQPPAPASQETALDLRPGIPDTSLLASASWRAAWRQAAASPGRTFPPAGSPQLRQQLAQHLRLTRSVLRDPQDLMVTAGARDGFRLVLTALRLKVRGRPLRIAVENPGYPSLQRIPLAFGHQILPVEVDQDGLQPALLPTGPDRPDLVLLAPSHQYPLGASMPVSRRLELLAWARKNGAYILEDDYDSELRYRGDPLPALAALDQVGEERVITLGSFSKLLAPGLNLGFLLLPAHLRQELIGLRADLGNPVSSLTQEALTLFLASGGLRRHTARMRRIYTARRQLLLTGLGQLPWGRVLPMDGGLHTVIHLPGLGAAEEAQLVARLAEAGLLVEALGPYWSPQGTSGQGNQERAEPWRGLVLGFGGVPDRKLEQGLGLLRQVLKELTPG